MRCTDADAEEKKLFNMISKQIYEHLRRVRESKIEEAILAF